MARVLAEIHGFLDEFLCAAVSTSANRLIPWRTNYTDIDRAGTGRQGTG